MAEKENFLSGWKSILTTVGGAGGLALADVPAHLVWPLTVVLAVAIAGFTLQGVAKEWRRK